MNFKKYSIQSDLLPAGLPQHSIVTAQAGVTTLGKNLAIVTEECEVRSGDMSPTLFISTL